MKLGELIKELETVKSQHGDLNVISWDGDLQKIDARPCANGLVPDADETPNEICLEFSWSD